VSLRRILLVDDEPNIRFLLTAIFEQAGYAVDVAGDGLAALRQIQQCVPSLVITDLRMPNMNGFKLLAVIRTRFPELPTVAISGEFLALDVREGVLADVFFQNGNYEIPDFLDKISDLLDKPDQRASKTPSPSSPSLWAPANGAPPTLTCTDCLRSFPMEPSNGTTTSLKTICVFCGSQLEI
jgi:CheY-like chemotaxis protein